MSKVETKRSLAVERITALTDGTSIIKKARGSYQRLLTNPLDNNI